MRVVASDSCHPARRSARRRLCRRYEDTVAKERQRVSVETRKRQASRRLYPVGAATENPTPWLRRRCTRGPTPLFYHADVRPWPLAGQPRIVLLRRRGAASLAANSTADLIRERVYDFPSPGKKRRGVPLRSDGKLASLPARLRRPSEKVRRARTWLRHNANSW